MLGAYFYNKTIRKTVSVFGSLFNNIQVRKTSGDRVLSATKVPLAYGPLEKFLARIDELEKLEEQAVAIKGNKRTFAMTNGDETRRRTVPQSVPYIISMDLNIMSKTQDEALQIVEQILPTFAPEYTVTVKDFEGPGSRTDVPIVLTGTSFSNEYEGDFTTRQLIVYTLNFSVKVKFAGGVSEQGIILDVDIDFFDKGNDGFLEEVGYTADSESDDSIPRVITDSDDGI